MANLTDPRQPSRKMTEYELVALLAAEKSDAMSAGQASKLSSDRSKALDYYLGNVSADIPDIDGRSKAVSTDVADTVDGMMPQLMEIFCGSDDVVEFTPTGPEDVAAAEQETDYVNWVFSQKNPGFLILYSFIKDALLTKNGVVKVWTEDETTEDRETFLDQPDDAFALLAANPELEIVAHSAHPPDGYQQQPGMPPPPMLHDVTVACKRSYRCHKVAVVPPEEFGISRYARDIASCGYCFHETKPREGELIDQGYDPEQCHNLPSQGSVPSNQEMTARDSVDESQMGAGDQGMNRANRRVMITEHHVRLDYEGDGKIRLYRIVTGGLIGQIMKRNGELEIIEEDHIPMAAMTPVIITHRFWGRSIADLTMDIQRIKTALTRALLDNAYMAVNPRPEVAETASTEQTLDDLLNMRPGQPIRVKTVPAINWQEVPFVAGQILPVMQFMDTIREWRSGVSRQGQGVDPNALQNQVATIANQMADQASAKIRLIARIFAETGIKDLFTLLHAEIRRNGDQQQIARLRNKWVTVDPADWKTRQDMTINVGLGTGNKAFQLANLQTLIAAQTQAIQVGMVSKKNLFKSASDLVRLIGKKDVESYFTPPGAPLDPNDPAAQPIQPPPDPVAAAAQQKNQIAAGKAQADVALQHSKQQTDTALAAQQQQNDQAIAVQKHRFDMELASAQAKAEGDLELARIAKEYELKTQEMLLDARLKREQFEAEAKVKIELARIMARAQRDGKANGGPTPSAELGHDVQIGGAVG